MCTNVIILEIENGAGESSQKSRVRVSLIRFTGRIFMLRLGHSDP